MLGEEGNVIVDCARRRGGGRSGGGGVVLRGRWGEVRQEVRLEDRGMGRRVGCGFSDKEKTREKRAELDTPYTTPSPKKMRRPESGTKKGYTSLIETNISAKKRNFW